MKCYNCSSQIPDGMSVCPKCSADRGFSQELIDKARVNDQGAITELYNKTYSGVYRTITALVKDEDAALDILQDSYIKAFKSLDQLKDADKFRPWVKRIAHNRCIDYLRQRKPVLFCEMSGDDDDTAVDFEDTREENLPEVSMDKKETARLLREILNSLPEDQRAVISMFYYEEMTVKEISRELGVTENTVKSRLSYGRKKIEAKVLELEKKGTKLYGLSPIPFLLLLFRLRDSRPASVPKKVTKKILTAGADSAGRDLGPKLYKDSSYAVSGAAKGAAAGGAKKSLTMKIIAAVTAACLLTGGATAIGYFTRDAKRVDTPSHYTDGNGTPMGGMGKAIADSDMPTESTEPVYTDVQKQVVPPSSAPKTTTYTDPEGIISLELPEAWSELTTSNAYREFNENIGVEGYYISFLFERTYDGMRFTGYPLTLVVYDDPSYDPGDPNGDQTQIERSNITMQTLVARSDNYTVFRRYSNGGRSLYYTTIESESNIKVDDPYQTEQYQKAQQDYNRLPGSVTDIISSIVINK